MRSYAFLWIPRECPCKSIHTRAKQMPFAVTYIHTQINTHTSTTHTTPPSMCMHWCIHTYTHTKQNTQQVHCIEGDEGEYHYSYRTAKGCVCIDTYIHTHIQQVHCIEGDEGEYHYSYRTAKAGVYFVSAMLNGVDIGTCMRVSVYAHWVHVCMCLYLVHVCADTCTHCCLLPWMTKSLPHKM
jgi:hypothetical protein